MKKTMRNSGTLMLVLAIAFTFTFSATAIANDEVKNTTAAIELKFIGNYENQPVFQLNLANTQDDEFTITFRDEYGNVLYTDKVKGSNITKRFMLNEEIGDGILSVEVKAKKSNKAEVYKINRTRTYVEETVVNKIK